MPAWMTSALFLSFFAATAALAQAPATDLAPSAAATRWRPLTRTRETAGPTAAGGATLVSDNGAASTPPVTRTSQSSDVLPNSAGQLWRQYDISAYTNRVTDSAKPEQAVVDWILRETGTEVWFSEPLGLLSANRTTLSVYHTPEMQAIVKEIVDRFINRETETNMIGLRLMTVGSPNWRSKAYLFLRPVNVQTPGIEAWLLSKENAALLIADLAKRSDFREYSSPNLYIQNGQSQVLTRTRPKNFVRSIRMREGAWPSHELDMAQIDEGFALQVSPLLSLDGGIVDVVIKCQVDQVERFVPIEVDIPAPPTQRQKVEIQVPQMVSWRLHERFRWPGDQVLLLSCGVVATPGPETPSMLGIPKMFNGGPSRADALLFLESKGKASQALVEVPQAAGRPAASYRGRY